MRGGLARDQYGMQHEGLFSRATAGTKRIVEKYHDTTSYALDFICDSEIEDEEIPTDAKLAFFNETRHSYGRSALLLSGGAYLGYYHLGVVKALWNESLLPRVISGASAGSLMAGTIGTRNDDELRGILCDSNECTAESLSFRRDYFQQKTDVDSPAGRQVQRLLPTWVRRFADPWLSLVFDNKIVNLDTEHFKSVVYEVGAGVGVGVAGGVA
jgi:TAG lipase/steryl ester hydrolase/phospholipase A2/LPA acyltransferase